MTARDFERANEAQWSELERAVSREDKALDPERFLFLYRAACEHLALAEARGFPAPLVSRLSSVTARAHQIVYRQTDLGLGRIARTLMHSFPAEVRIHRWYVLIAALLVVAPAVALGYAVAHRPDLILSLADSTTVEEFGRMYDPANAAIGRLRDAGTNWTMFGFYIANNIGIAFQCYVSGILFGLGSLYYLAFNGAFGGAVAGYVTSMGFAGTFFPFIATHSALRAHCGGAQRRCRSSNRTLGAPARPPYPRSLAPACRAGNERDRIRIGGHAGDRRRRRGLLVLGGLGESDRQILGRRGLLAVGCDLLPEASACRLTPFPWCCVLEPFGRAATSGCACCNPGCARSSRSISPSRCRCSRSFC